MLQCAYGSFRREVALPVAVSVTGASATYDNGVLRIELPKADPGRPKARTIPVH
jgi:HSP20 family protein